VKTGDRLITATSHLRLLECVAPGGLIADLIVLPLTSLLLKSAGYDSLTLHPRLRLAIL
jgi:hypothetical protein